MLNNKNLLNSALKYSCNFCNYFTCKKSSYNDHLLSTKHKKSMVSNDFSNQILLNSACSKYTCQNCNKEYKDNSGLWRHKKKCVNNNILNNKENDFTSETKTNVEEITALKDIMKYLIKENSEMKTLMMEQQNFMMEQQSSILKVIENGTHNNTINNTTHTNSHSIFNSF